MGKPVGNEVYTVIHFIRKNNDWNFAGFQGVYANMERVEKAIDANMLVKGECDNDYFRHYLSKDGNHRWEISKTMVK